jgi:hypothetical protein
MASRVDIARGSPDDSLAPAPALLRAPATLSRPPRVLTGLGPEKWMSHISP